MFQRASDVWALYQYSSPEHTHTHTHTHTHRETSFPLQPTVCLAAGALAMTSVYTYVCLTGLVLWRVKRTCAVCADVCVCVCVVCVCVCVYTFIICGLHPGAWCILKALCALLVPLLDELSDLNSGGELRSQQHTKQRAV